MRHVAVRLRWIFALIAGIALLAPGQPARAQLDQTDLAVLQLQGLDEKWTFEVGENSATTQTMDQLCGMRAPDGWQSMAPYEGEVLRATALPNKYDWRDYNGVTPIRNQGGCGSCWAFSTVAPLECAIKIKTGASVNLSEQWLVSCNRDGWGCGGGWNAHDYHLSKKDDCAGNGAVLESAFPYQAKDVACDCPYLHSYWIQSWKYIGGGSSIPSPDAIKQAIQTYGPVACSVTVDGAFQAYKSGVFNSSASGDINHGVALVGWDDTQGKSGVWIMRNSWGTGWGESGYMRIEYGCSKIGFAANYVVFVDTPPPVRTLTVASATPNSGVSITVSPADKNGATNGTTQFTRRYDNGDMVTLTAPAMAADGSDFQKWQKDGANFTGNTNRSVQIQMDLSHTLTAIYYNQPRTLTVASSDSLSGVSITVSPADKTGAANGTTQFTRIYNNLTTVTLTAPLTWGATRSFLKWQKDGANFTNNTQAAVVVTMSANHAMTAIYQPTPRTLTVASTNPDAGVTITAAPPDSAGAGNGQTGFTRTYGHGTLVTLTAPPTALAGGRTFSKWLRGGVDFSGNGQKTVRVTMNADYKMTAVYLPTLRSVAVASSNPAVGVPVTLSPADKSGGGGGATPFARVFDDGTRLTIGAPVMLDGKVFAKWLLGGATLSGQAVAQWAVDANSTLTAVYQTPDRTCWTLSVSAAIYGAAAPIAVAPADYCGAAGGVTPFARAYRAGDSVTLTAPATCDASGIAYRFKTWMLDGAILTDNLDATVTMNAAHSIQALFEPLLPQGEAMLLVASINPGSGVPIALDVADKIGASDGMTPFNRTYDVTPRLAVSLTAPVKAGGNQFFSKWLLDGGDFLGADRQTVKIPLGASHIVSAVYDTRSTCSLIADSADPDAGVAIAVSLADLNGAQDGLTDLRRIYDVGSTVTLTAPPSADKGGQPYAFYKWLRDGKDLDAPTTCEISVVLTEDATFTAVYAGNWYEDYIIAYSDALPNHKFRYQMGHPKYGVPPAGIVTAGEGIVLPYQDSGPAGALSVTPNRKALQGRAPRTIPQIMTAGSFGRAFIAANVARKYAGAIEAAGVIKSLSMIGGCAMDVRATEIGSLRMTAPQAHGNYLTAIHTSPPEYPAPANGRRFLTANISLAGVALAELDAPYQPVCLLAQTKRYGGSNPMILPSSLGLTTTSLRAAIARKITMIGGEIDFGEISSQLPADASQSCYPSGKDVSILARLLTLGASTYPAHVRAREINVEAGLRLSVLGGDIAGDAAAIGQAFPARIVAGGRIYGVSALPDRKSGIGGYLGWRPEAGAAGAQIPPAIALVAGAGAPVGAVCDIANVNGAAGANAWFYAGAAPVACDPCLAPQAVYAGKLSLLTKTREPGAIRGAAFVAKDVEQDLVLRLRALRDVVSPDFQVNGKKLSEW
ncbi:MAG: C1 family peptidase [Candidatus Sumerlaeota bacterium]|nr:C1 family peptidase [Candidatus Sumerlaeota bacterium]